MTTLAADIDTLTYIYLAALKSNSDEIARLAEALRKAEAERDAEHDASKLNSENFESELKRWMDDAERLANAVIVAEHSLEAFPKLYPVHRNTSLAYLRTALEKHETALAAHVSATAGTDDAVAWERGAGRVATGKAVRSEEHTS